MYMVWNLLCTWKNDEKKLQKVVVFIPKMPKRKEQKSTSNKTLQLTLQDKLKIISWHHANGAKQTKTVNHFQKFGFPSLTQPLLSKFSGLSGACIRAVATKFHLHSLISMTTKLLILWWWPTRKTIRNNNSRSKTVPRSRSILWNHHHPPTKKRFSTFLARRRQQQIYVTDRAAKVASSRKGSWSKSAKCKNLKKI